jgi:sugar/nucleoside kinase (ribokinase family)
MSEISSARGAPMRGSVTRVVCIGDVMVDVLARLPHALAVGSDTPAPISFLGGGSAANTAAWLVAAGVPTTFVGQVGDDILGRMALDELRNAGIDLAVTVDPARATGACIVLVDADGERTMVPAAGANDGLGSHPLPAGLISAGTAVHVSGYTLFREGSRAAAEQAAASARDQGSAFSADAASSAPLAAFGPERFLGWLATAGPAPLLFANLDEARVLIRRDPSSAAVDEAVEEAVEEAVGEALDDALAKAVAVARELASRCGQVVVKCGAAGAIWSDGEEAIHAATDPAGPTAMIDSTGAGDAFAAGMLAALLRDEPVLAALHAANALARQAITRTGARPAQ